MGLPAGFAQFRADSTRRTLGRHGRHLPAGLAARGLLLGLCAALLAGWFATGHASAPDDGLLQIDVLSLHERVAGVEPVDGRPTMVVLAGRCPVARTASLGPAYGVVVHRAGDEGYADLTRRLALPQALDRCVPGYVLVDADGFVRYRTYDPGWHAHAQEQEILLDALGGMR